MFKRGRGYKVSPEEVKKIIHLFTVEKKSIKEIKEITKRSDSSISTIVHPFKERLRLPPGTDRVIIKHIASGMRSLDISKEMEMDLDLAEKAISQIKRKYRARNYAHLVSIAYQNGVLKTG